MSLKATEQPAGGKNFDSPALDAGTYPARIVGVSVVGKHPQSYNGEEKEPKDVIAFTYELLDEFMQDEEGNDVADKPRWITENMAFHNLSNSRAKSSERYMSVDPEQVHEGDWAKLLATPVMISLVRNAGKGANTGRIFNNVDSIAPMRPKEAAKAPELVNKPFLFDFYEPSKNDWDRAPALIKLLCRKALNFKGTEMEDWDVLDGENKDQPIKIEDAPVKKKKVETEENDW